MQKIINYLLLLILKINKSINGKKLEEEVSYMYSWKEKRLKAATTIHYHPVNSQISLSKYNRDHCTKNGVSH